jgi:serine/threonine-protein kinase
MPLPETSLPGALPPPAAAPQDSLGALGARLFGTRGRRNATVLTVSLGIALLGYWTYWGVRNSLREVRAGGLQTVLAAEVSALQIWVDEKKADAERWAGDARVRGYVHQLVELARARGPASRFCDAPARVHLAGVLKQVLKDEGSATFNVIDRNGLIIASQFREYCGLQVKQATFLADMADVFEGHTRFIRPYPEHERIHKPPVIKLDRPLVWIEAPMHGPKEEIIAALGFGKFADRQFAAILGLARPGRTGEVYAFDESGIMLSQSRFADELRALGLIPADAGPMPHVQLRDPGGDLTAGHAPELELAARPLTRLAAVAIASSAKRDPDEQRGIVLAPYRNYRGIEVIGAWQWLPAYEMGVAIEIAADEAYAPLRYLNVTFTLIFALLIALSVAALYSSFSLLRLRLRVREAPRLGQYTLERQIGEGGMATVFLARHALLKRPTAVKILKRHLANDEIIARFEREVQLASRLAHPNTIEIYDYGRTRGGDFYYAMEYLEGVSLAEFVTAEGAMPPARVAHILRQVCAALREVHDQGLVHRDIKPDNIMLCRRGGEYDVVKVLDFGIVKNVGKPDTRDITQFVRVLGAPLYMAPERLANPADVDARSDIYSVGAVGYYLLTGHALYTRTTDAELAQQIRYAPPQRPSAAGTQALPGELDDLIFQCLAKARDERPQHIAAVLAVLERVTRDLPWTAAAAEAWWRERWPAFAAKKTAGD